MSTFGGFMPEFPDIRVDYARQIPDRPPPLACFLSHVHSDHLTGLDSYWGNFIYCSAATKELLLRLETYHCRINYARGILESRVQHFKRLESKLKPLPLETPTRIELAPGNEIQVTLFDANHCTGAVMFLIEGGGKAVLYTGDLRAELWLINNLTRNPYLLEYAAGLKRLDTIYLDTTFLEPIEFPTKAEGIRELLEKVAKYPPNTKFHFTAWTFGYEEVWMALSKALNSKIHVDDYKLRIYHSLRNDTKKNAQPGACLTREGPVLGGFKCANTHQPGCLTWEQSVRLHSCEKGTPCTGMDDDVVRILPIITREKDGREIREVGAGGGGGDLIQTSALELESIEEIFELVSKCDTNDETVQSKITKLLSEAFHSKQHTMSLNELGLEDDQDGVTLQSLLSALESYAARKKDEDNEVSEQDAAAELPKLITFPYSRHSSYDELVNFVAAFEPKDVYPCTVDKVRWNEEEISIDALFGLQCSGRSFRHDREMAVLFNGKKAASVAPSETTEATARDYDYDDSQDSLASLHDVFENRVQSPPATFAPARRQSMPSPEAPFGMDGGSSQMASSGNDGAVAAPQDYGELELVGSHPEARESPSGDRRRKASDEPLNEASSKRPRTQSPESDEADLLMFAPPGGWVNPNPHNTEWDFSAISENGGSSPPLNSDERDLANNDDSPVKSDEDPAKSDRASSSSSGPSEADSQEDVSRAEPMSFLSSDQSSLSAREAHEYEQRGFLAHPNDLEQQWGENMQFWDEADEVFRCASCYWELWHPLGHCTNCDKGRAPYMEVLDPDRHIGDYYPELYGYDGDMDGDIMGVDEDDDYGIYGPDGPFGYYSPKYMDGPDAYSEPDEDHLHDEYEVDSFIDDASVHSEQPDDEAEPSDVEPDYKTLYQDLSRAHGELLEDYEGMKREFMGSDYGSDTDDEVVVEPKNAGPAVADQLPSVPNSRPSQHSQQTEAKYTVFGKKKPFHLKYIFGMTGIFMGETQAAEENWALAQVRGKLHPVMSASNEGGYDVSDEFPGLVLDPLKIWRVRYNSALGMAVLNRVREMKQKRNPTSVCVHFREGCIERFLEFLRLGSSACPITPIEPERIKNMFRQIVGEAKRAWQGDDQSEDLDTVLSEARKAAREEAYHAVLSPDGAGWHELGLVSSGRNHTEPEIEL